MTLRVPGSSPVTQPALFLLLCFFFFLNRCTTTSSSCNSRGAARAMPHWLSIPEGQRRKLQSAPKNSDSWVSPSPSPTPRAQNFSILSTTASKDAQHAPTAQPELHRHPKICSASHTDSLSCTAVVNLSKREPRMPTPRYRARRKRTSSP